jgi:hypothetical protein
MYCVTVHIASTVRSFDSFQSKYYKIKFYRNLFSSFDDEISEQTDGYDLALKRRLYICNSISAIKLNLTA